MANLWPEALACDTQAIRSQAHHIWTEMPETWQQQIDDCWLPLATYLMRQTESYQQQHKQPPVLAVHGGQGSGKSTLCNALASLYQQTQHWKVAVISLDDLYLSKAERQQLSEEIHPLLATRGVPGTHDVATGKQLLKQLRQLDENKYLSYPAFDKISDDRLPQQQWHGISGPVDLILLEGWCVACRPVASGELQQPINELEAAEDSTGLWRHWVNQQLQDNYRSWFSEIDMLLMLKVPDISCVIQWRTQQEIDNIKNSQSDQGMTGAQITRFVQHYQRITEQALKDMPGYADLILELNTHHQVSAVHYAESQTMWRQKNV